MFRIPMTVPRKPEDEVIQGGYGLERQVKTEEREKIDKQYC